MSDLNDYDPDVAAEEKPHLDAIAARLVRERPLPAAGFRGDLRRRVTTGSARVRPTRRWGFTLAGVGATLLATAAIGLVNVGPLAPQPVQTAAQSAQVR